MNSEDCRDSIQNGTDLLPKAAGHATRFGPPGERIRGEREKDNSAPDSSIYAARRRTGS